MKKNYYAILMAGGVGSRFWPVSTLAFPKQFHDMLGTGETLLQRTFKRLEGLIPQENIFVLTNSLYNSLVLEQLPNITERQILLEPAMRNTAPCILYAAFKIQKENPDAVMVVAPSDHWIEDEVAFTEDIQRSFDEATSKDVLMTLGVKPTFPNTGYGYIQYEKGNSDGVQKVQQFTEKPNYQTAKSFLAEGNYLWNAGIFIWSVSSVLRAFHNFQPKLYQLFEKGLPFYNTESESAFIQDNYALADNISVDYAILESSPNIYVLPASFDWNDLGTWGSLYEKLPKASSRNAIVNAQVICYKAEGNMIRTAKGKVVVIDGLNDYIVVDKEEVLLICPKSKEQDIKMMLAEAKKQFGEQLA